MNFDIEKAKNLKKKIRPSTLRRLIRCAAALEAQTQVQGTREEEEETLVLPVLFVGHNLQKLLHKPKDRFIHRTSIRDDDEWDTSFSHFLCPILIEAHKFPKKLEDLTNYDDGIQYILGNLSKMSPEDFDVMIDKGGELMKAVENFTALYSKLNIEDINDWSAEARWQEDLKAKKDEGIEKGREEERENLVKALLAKGFNVEVIYELTGASPQEVAELSQN